jgi:hypothetical protein
VDRALSDCLRSPNPVSTEVKNATPPAFSVPPPTGPQHEQAPAPAAAADGTEHAGQHVGPLHDVFTDERPLDAAAAAFTPGHSHGHQS